MQFNSYSYLVLLLIAVAVFWALPQRARRWFVLALSIAFYATWSPIFIIVPIALCVGVYWMARRAASGQNKNVWYTTSIIYALSFLLLFRYHTVIGSALASLERSFRISPGRTIFQIAVPLGISFYTLEAIS